MRPIVGCLAALGALAVLGCSVGKESRSVEFLTLNGGAPAADPPPRATGLRIVVERFRAPEIYDMEQIAWREGALIQKFKFCRWAGSPTDMLQEVLVRGLRESGKFESVDRSAAGRSDAPFALRGEIDALYFQASSQAGKWEVRLEGHVTLVHATEDPKTREKRSEVLAEYPLVEQGKEGSFLADAVQGEDNIPHALKTMVEALVAHLNAQAATIAEDTARKVAALRH